MPRDSEAEESWQRCIRIAIARIRAYEGGTEQDAIRELKIMAQHGSAHPKSLEQNPGKAPSDAS